jgi:hypothetical protein
MQPNEWPSLSVYEYATWDGADRRLIRCVFLRRGRTRNPPLQMRGDAIALWGNLWQS